MNHPEEFTKTTPNHIIKWVLKERQHKGKVLGCLGSTKGIEANPDKVKALQNMEEPQYVRDVQKMTGRIAALNRFIPRSADRSLPFFKTL